MTERSKIQIRNTMARWALVAGVAAVALLGSYAFAASRSAAPAQAATPRAAVASAPASGSSGCACCGAPKPAGPATTGQATTSGSVQKISVDVSKGYYDPSNIVLKVGVPAEITFSASSGCTGQVQSQDLGFSADLTQGPATVKLPALSVGTYAFACGMNMVHGTVTVK